MKFSKPAVSSPKRLEIRSKGKITLLKSLSVAVFTAVVSSGFPLAPAQAAGTYDGANGTVLCTTGYFTIALNVVTGHTECAGAVVIPAGVTSIASPGFANSSITSVAFSGTSTLTTIGVSAFQSTPSLTSIDIPASVTTIDFDAFAFTNALTSITVDGANANYSSLGGVLFNKDQSSLIAYASGISPKTYSIPASVTSIAGSAFKGSSLTSVTIPANVTSIGDGAFGGSFSLASVVFSGTSTLATIGGYAFNATTSLTSITIPASVTSIGMGAFSDATALTSVAFLGTSMLATISDNTFESSGLTSITIPASVTSIGEAAFRYARSLESVVFSGASTLATIGVQAFSSSGLTSITIPASVTSIGLSAFDGAMGLASVVFSGTSTLATIGNNAFNNAAFTAVTIPSSVRTIGQHAFLSNNLTSITVAADNQNYSSSDGVLFDKQKTSLINYPASKLATTYSIPISVTRIEVSAFYSADFTTVTIPSSVAIIGDSAFSSTDLLTSITVAAENQNYSSLDGVLFDKQRTSVITYPRGKLTEAYSIPTSVARIEASAFYGARFYSVTIPSSISFIGNYAFMYARSNLNVYFLGNAPTVGSDAFQEVNGKAYIKTGATGFAAVGTAWKGLTVADLDDGVRSCATGTYTIQDFVVTNGYSCAGAAVIADGVQAIQTQTFMDNQSLTSVTIPASVMSIGPNSFARTPALTSFSVDLANPNFSSEDGVLFNKNKSSLLLFPAARGNAQYVVPSSVDSIQEYAFYGASQLANVVFLGNAPTVGVEAFTDVAAGAKATISASATGFPAAGSAWNGLTVEIDAPPAAAPPTEVAPVVTTPAVVTPVVTTPPAVVAPVVTTPPAVVSPVVTTPAVAAIVTTTPVVSAVGTSVSISREPSAAVASAVAIGVSKTKVMVALKVPKASKPANQVTKYVIQLKSAKGAIITKTISVKAGGTVKPTLTGKKKTTYSMTVTAVTKSGKKTTWKGPQVKTS